MFFSTTSSVCWSALVGLNSMTSGKPDRTHYLTSAVVTGTSALKHPIRAYQNALNLGDELGGAGVCGQEARHEVELVDEHHVSGP